MSNEQLLAELTPILAASEFKVSLPVAFEPLTVLKFVVGLATELSVKMLFGLYDIRLQSQCYFKIVIQEKY